MFFSPFSLTLFTRQSADWERKHCPILFWPSPPATPIWPEWTRRPLYHVCCLCVSVYRGLFVRLSCVYVCIFRDPTQKTTCKQARKEIPQPFRNGRYEKLCRIFYESSLFFKFYVFHIQEKNLVSEKFWSFFSSLLSFWKAPCFEGLKEASCCKIVLGILRSQPSRHGLFWPLREEGGFLKWIMKQLAISPPLKKESETSKGTVHWKR